MQRLRLLFGSRPLLSSVVLRFVCLSRLSSILSVVGHLCRFCLLLPDVSLSFLVKSMYHRCRDVA